MQRGSWIMETHSFGEIPGKTGDTIIAQNGLSRKKNRAATKVAARSKGRLI